MMPLREHRWFVLAISVYLALAVVLVLVNHRHQREHLLDDIDQRLLVVTHAVPHILADDFHDRAVGPEGISRDEDLRNQKQLTDYAEVTGVRWIWTDVEHEGRFYITACNRTEQSDQPGLATDYWVEYDTVSADEQRASRGTEPVYSTHTDKWGTFRAVFVPRVSPAGRTYMACAEYELSHVQEQLWRNATKAVLAFLLLLLAVVPLLWLHLRQTRRHQRTLAGANTMLERNRRQLATILDASDDAVLATGAGGDVRWANAVAARWLVSGGTRLEGQPLDHLVTLVPARRGAPPLPGPWRMLCDGPSGLPEDDLILPIVSGEQLIVRATAAPLPPDDTGQAGVVLVLRDVSRQRELEASMRRSQKLETVGRLAGGVAHDFNNLLMSIQGSAELLQDHIRGDATAQEDVERILAAANRAAGLTRQLLLFSRRRPEATQVVDLHELVHETATLLRHSLDRAITFEVMCTATQHRVLGEPALLSSTIMNLAVNARDAMPTGGRLDLVTRDAGPDEPDGTVILEVADTGEGMPPEVVEHVFEPFYSTKEVGRGTGLGLAVVDTTVRGMGGEIVIDSEPGRGTVMRLLLPLTTDPVTRDDDRRVPALDGAVLQGLRVLVVDDEAELRAVALKALQRHGARVDLAEDGLAAEAKLAAEGRYDLVLLDLVMPGRSGLQTLPVIRQQYPELPVLLCSGYDPTHKAGTLSDTRGIGYLAKPYTREELVTAILDLLAEVRDAVE